MSLVVCMKSFEGTSGGFETEQLLAPAPGCPGFQTKAYLTLNAPILRWPRRVPSRARGIILRYAASMVNMAESRQRHGLFKSLPQLGTPLSFGDPKQNLQTPALVSFRV